MLDDKARKQIFVGCEERTRGYGPRDMNADRIQISQNGTFREGDPRTNQAVLCDTGVCMNVSEHLI